MEETEESDLITTSSFGIGGGGLNRVSDRVDGSLYRSSSMRNRHRTQSHQTQNGYADREPTRLEQHARLSPDNYNIIFTLPFVTFRAYIYFTS